MKKLVYLSEKISESALKRLLKNFDVTDNFDEPEKISAVITRKIEIREPVIKKLVNCRIISNHGTGSDQIDVKAAEKAGIIVKSTPGENARSVAELALGFFISLSFKMKYLNEGLKQNRFEKFGLKEMEGNELNNKKLGLIGSGNTARILAEIMKKAFNAEVYCWNPRRTAEELKKAGFIKVSSVENLLSECDFVSVHVPLTPETENLINEKTLEKANPDLILVNTARGGIVNEKALYDSLVTGKIKAAACDVFVKEPPEKSNPLLSLENFIATPHVAGSTKEALDRVGNLTVRHIEEVLL